MMGKELLEGRYVSVSTRVVYMSVYVCIIDGPNTPFTASESERP